MPLIFPRSNGASENFSFRSNESVDRSRNVRTASVLVSSFVRWRRFTPCAYALLFMDWREDPWLVANLEYRRFECYRAPLLFYGWRRTSMAKWGKLRPCRLAHTACNTLGRLAQADYRVILSDRWLSSQKRFCWPHPTANSVPQEYHVDTECPLAADSLARLPYALELAPFTLNVPRTDSRANQDTC